MSLLSNFTKTPLGVWALIGLMLLTRAHSAHFGTPINLPDASLAVFFMAGLWFGGLRLFTLLLLEAGLIDYVAITQMNVSDYCISPAYGFLIPAYAVLFWAGRTAACHDGLQTRAILMQMLLLIIGTSLSFVISNGSFYLLSGRFADVNWIEYTRRVVQYYPYSLTSVLAYGVSIVGVVKVVNLLKSVVRSNGKVV